MQSNVHSKNREGNEETTPQKRTKPRYFDKGILKTSKDLPVSDSL